MAEVDQLRDRVAELEHVVEDQRRKEADLVKRLEARVASSSSDTSRLTLRDVEALEKRIYLQALEKVGWRIYGVRGAAALLGIPPTTLSSRLKKLGLKKPGG